MENKLLTLDDVYQKLNPTHEVNATAYDIENSLEHVNGQLQDVLDLYLLAITSPDFEVLNRKDPGRIIQINGFLGYFNEFTHSLREYHRQRLAAQNNVESEKGG